MDEVLQKKADKAEQRARQYFREGLNCSECVLRSFLDVNDIDLPDEIIALASGYGGGMGQTRNTCGAINGAMLAIGTVRGRRNPFAVPDTEGRIKEVREVYKPFRAFIEHLQEEYGTLNCMELSAPWKDDFGGKPRKKNCQKIIGHCAALAVEYSAWQPGPEGLETVTKQEN